MFCEEGWVRVCVFVFDVGYEELEGLGGTGFLLKLEIERWNCDIIVLSKCLLRIQILVQPNPKLIFPNLNISKLRQHQNQLKFTHLILPRTIHIKIRNQPQNLLQLSQLKINAIILSHSFLNHIKILSFCFLPMNF